MRRGRAEFDRLIQNKEDVSSREYRLWNCLKIPFFLIMYCFVSERQGITRQGEILKRFFHDKREPLNDSVTYGEKVQSQEKYKKKSYGQDTKLRMDLSIRVLLDFIIPEMAIEMVSTNHFYITWKRLAAFLEDTLKALQNGKHVRWMKTYYGYEADVREIFARIYEIDKGERIAEYACDVLGIMRMTADKALFFTHQYFRDYFAACAIKNRMLYALEVQEEKRSIRQAKSFVPWSIPSMTGNCQYIYAHLLGNCWGSITICRSMIRQTGNGKCLQQRKTSRGYSDGFLICTGFYGKKGSIQHRFLYVPD